MIIEEVNLKNTFTKIITELKCSKLFFFLVSYTAGFFNNKRWHVGHINIFFRYKEYNFAINRSLETRVRSKMTTCD